MKEQETSSHRISALSFFLFLIIWPAVKQPTKRNQHVNFSYVVKVFFGLWLSTQHQDFFLVKWIMFSWVSRPSIALTSINTINVINITRYRSLAMDWKQQMMPEKTKETRYLIYGIRKRFSKQHQPHPRDRNPRANQRIRRLPQKNYNGPAT